MRKEIELYLKKGEFSTSILLEGPRGLDQEQDAIELAAALLNTSVKRLLVHPDYLFVSCGKTTSIGVESASAIIQKASFMPSIANCIVVVISEMDRMTAQAQNKLLKLIEESRTVVLIGTSYSASHILDTIRSRVRVITYKPLSENTFIEYCKERGIANADILYHLVNGCPGLVVSDEMLDLFEQVKNAIASGSWINLLQILHLVEEKDPNHFFVKNERYVVKGLFSLILEKVTKSHHMPIEIVGLIEENINMCGLPSYTKDNFFYCIASLVEAGQQLIVSR